MPIIINKAFLIWGENVIGRLEMLIGFGAFNRLRLSHVQQKD